MKKEKQPIKVINIMKSGRIVEDMSTITMPVDIYQNVMRILLTSRQQREVETDEAEGRAASREVGRA